MPSPIQRGCLALSFVTATLLFIPPQQSFAQPTPPGMVAIPPDITFPQSGTWVSPSGNQYTFNPTTVTVMKGPTIVGNYIIMSGKVRLFMGGMDPKDMFNEMRSHKAAVPVPEVQAEAPKPESAPAAPIFTAGADAKSYKVVFSDGYTVNVTNNGNYIRISIPPVPRIPPEYTLMYTTAMKTFTNVTKAGSAHHDRTMDEFSAAGNWRTVGPGIDSRQDTQRGYVQQDVLHQSRLVPAPLHFASEKAFAAMNLAEANGYKTVGKTAMQFFTKLDFVGGQNGPNGGTVFDHDPQPAAQPVVAH